MLLTSDYGYFSLTGTNNSTATIKVKLPASVTVTNKQISFYGGIFTVTGNNLSPVSYLSINGFKCFIKKYTTSSVIYKVPAFITTNTLNEFELA